MSKNEEIEKKHSKKHEINEYKTKKGKSIKSLMKKKGK